MNLSEKLKTDFTKFHHRQEQGNHRHRRVQPEEEKLKVTHGRCFQEKERRGIRFHLQCLHQDWR